MTSSTIGHGAFRSWSPSCWWQSRSISALQLQETPIFQEIKAKGQMTKNPWREAFLSANIKFVLIASIVLIGQGVVWYSGQFWALYFLQQVSKVDPLTSAYIVVPRYSSQRRA